MTTLPPVAVLPPPEDFERVLSAAISATGVERYRWLCSDANRLRAPNSREDFRRWIYSRAWERPAIAVDYAPAIGGRPCGSCPG